MLIVTVSSDLLAASSLRCDKNGRHVLDIYHEFILSNSFSHSFYINISRPSVQLSFRHLLHQRQARAPNSLTGVSCCHFNSTIPSITIPYVFNSSSALRRPFAIIHALISLTIGPFLTHAIAHNIFKRTLIV